MKKWFSFGLFVFMSFIIFIMFFEPLIRKNAFCDLSEKYRIDNLHGIVIRKYRDSENHNYKTIEIKEESHKILKRNLTGDLSGLYEYISAGDSVYKPAGTLKTLVIRVNEKKYFTIDFGCKRVK